MPFQISGYGITATLLCHWKNIHLIRALAMYFSYKWILTHINRHRKHASGLSITRPSPLWWRSCSSQSRTPSDALQSIARKRKNATWLPFNVDRHSIKAQVCGINETYIRACARSIALTIRYLISRTNIQCVVPWALPSSVPPLLNPCPQAEPDQALEWDILVGETFQLQAQHHPWI